jgi:hypothetical protein
VEKKIEFRKLAKSPNFDIIVEEGRFEIELDQYGNPKSLIESGKDHRLNFGTNPIAKKYGDDIREYARNNKENFKAYWEEKLKNKFAKGSTVKGGGVLLNVGSHRARGKMKKSGISYVEKYGLEKETFGKHYYEINKKDLKKALEIKGIKVANPKGKLGTVREYDKGGKLEDELYVAEFKKGQWTVKDKKNPNANYTLSSKKENVENVRQALIDSPSKLKYYRSNEYATGGAVGSKSAKKIKIEGYLPVFTGFYNTIFEPNEEMVIEDGYEYDDYDFDYKKYYEDMGEACSDAIEEQLEDFEIKINFQEVVSPKAYNFSNDSFNVEYTVTPKSIAKITSYLKANKEAFDKYLKDNYTSRSGFMSSYSNDADDWFEDLKNAKKLEHIFGSILGFILQNEGYDQEKLYYDVADNVYLDGGLKESVLNNQDFIEEYAQDNYRNKSADEVISDIISKFEDEGTDYDESKVREIVNGYYNRVADQSLRLFRSGGNTMGWCYSIGGL